MDTYLQLINGYLHDIPLTKEPKNLYEPVAYCLANGGKRIRPVMTLLACEMFNGDVNEALPAAAGLELFHNFTLLHDDIMDDAPIRRNKPTVHVKWDDNTAILSGDVLFAIASQHVSRVPDNKLRQVLDLYYQTVKEICEGQQYDMDFEGRHDVTEEQYLEMIRLKTAVLPAACLKTGAIIAGANPDDQEKIYRFGEQIGMAFQIRDDWLDTFGDEGQFGKKTGGDILANKKTWLYVQALERADNQQREELLTLFKDKGEIPDQDKISRVKAVYEQLNLNNKALETTEAYYSAAFDVFQQINVPDDRKQPLENMTKNLLNRDK